MNVTESCLHAKARARDLIIFYMRDFIFRILSLLLFLFPDHIICPLGCCLDWRLLHSIFMDDDMSLCADTHTQGLSSLPFLPKVITGGKQPANKCLQHALRVLRSPSAADRQAGAIHGVWQIMRGKLERE